MELVLRLVADLIALDTDPPELDDDEPEDDDATPLEAGKDGGR